MCRIGRDCKTARLHDLQDPCPVLCALRPVLLPPAASRKPFFRPVPVS